MANICYLYTEKFVLEVAYRETPRPFWDALISRYRRPMTNGDNRDLDYSDSHDDVTKWSIFRVTGPLCGEFPAQRPVTRSFDVFFDLHLIKRLSKHSRGWWFETLSHPLWRHCNVNMLNYFKDYKKFIRISYYILDCIQQKKAKFTLEQPYMLPIFSILSIPCLLMRWRLQSPGHQQAWYWQNNPHYSVSTIRCILIMHIKEKKLMTC